MNVINRAKMGKIMDLYMIHQNGEVKDDHAGMDRAPM